MTTNVEKFIADQKMLKAYRQFRLSVKFPRRWGRAGAYVESPRCFVILAAQSKTLWKAKPIIYKSLTAA